MTQLQENENPGAGTPGFEALSKNLPEKYTESVESAQRNSSIDPTRPRHLARRLHALGERPLYELLREALDGAELSSRLEAYAALDGDFIAALGGDVLAAPLAVFDGGRA